MSERERERQRKRERESQIITKNGLISEQQVS